MNHRFALTAVAVALASTLGSQTGAEPGVVYTDAANDIASGLATAGGTLDLLSMEVSNTASDIVFKLTVNGDLNGTDWGKFMIGIAAGGAASSNGNGWGRPINMDSSVGGMTSWFGSWVDGGGGAENRGFSAGSWGLTGATYNGNFGGYSFAGNQITYTSRSPRLGFLREALSTLMPTRRVAAAATARSTHSRIPTRASPTGATRTHPIRPTESSRTPLCQHQACSRSSDSRGFPAAVARARRDGTRLRNGQVRNIQTLV